MGVCCVYKSLYEHSSAANVLINTNHMLDISILWIKKYLRKHLKIVWYWYKYVYWRFRIILDIHLIKVDIFGCLFNKYVTLLIPSLISWQSMHVGDNQYKNINGSVATRNIKVGYNEMAKKRCHSCFWYSLYVYFFFFEGGNSILFDAAWLLQIYS